MKSLRIVVGLILLIVSLSEASEDSSLEELSKKGIPSEKVEKEDHIIMADRTIMENREDEHNPHSSQEDRAQDEELNKIALFYKEFQEARLTDDRDLIERKLEDYLGAVDQWNEESIRASDPKQRGAIMKMSRRLLELVKSTLSKEGVADEAISATDSNLIKSMKAAVASETIRIRMLQTHEPIERSELAKKLAMVNEEYKMHVRNSAHDEL